jgi:serine/threonine-protein kinase RIO1
VMAIMSTTISENQNNFIGKETMGDALTDDSSPEINISAFSSSSSKVTSKHLAWNLPATGVSSAGTTVGEKKENAIKKQTFAEIMAEQTQDRIAAQIASCGIDLTLAESQAEQERLFQSLRGGEGGSRDDGLASSSELGLSAEELRMIEQAMQDSDSIRMSQQGLSGHQTDIFATASSSAAFAASASMDGENHLTEREMEQIEKAIREAEANSNCCNDNLKNPAPQSDIASSIGGNETSGLSAEDVAAIQAAIKEADNKAEAESLRVALQMQQEEIRRVEQHNDRRAKQCGKGNVRTMTRAELQAEEERLHEGVDLSLVVEDEDDYEDEDVGFRMNSKVPSSQWVRHDRNLIVGKDNQIRTKHDVHVQGQSNAQILALDTDDWGVRAHVGNQAFNSFKKTMKRTTKGVASHGTGRAGTDTDATKGKAMDNHVRLIITGAINSELILQCNGAVKQGKEAMLYHADKGVSSVCGNFDVAVKVFKRIKEFRTRGEYVDGDPRYAGRQYKSMTSREKLESWTEKEFRNLVRAHRAKVPVPTPLEFKQNVLFMRFMGNDGWPAPQIREINLRKGSRKWDIWYKQVMESIRRLYVDARLIHGDLSEYNILIVPVSQVDHPNNPEEGDVQPVFIDFGQAVDTRHPEAMELLERDLLRIKEFFVKQGVTTMSMEEAKLLIINDDKTLVDEKLERVDEHVAHGAEDSNAGNSQA